MPDGRVPVGELTGSEYMGGLKSFVINISEQQLTDKVTYVTADNYADVGDAVEGQYYNFNFSYIVNKTRQQGKLQTCECTADVDELLYSSISYDSGGILGEEEKSAETEGEELLSVNKHLEIIADILEKKLSIHLQEVYNRFTPTLELPQKEVTIADIISSLLGWSARTPYDMINFFLRGDILYVVQRGAEPNRIDISKTNHTKPVIEREYVRFTWSGEPDSKTTVTTKKPGISYTWKEKVEGEDKKSKYTYNEENLIKNKEVRNDDGSRVETTYFYKKVNGTNFLYLEREEYFEKYGDNNPTVTETYYTSLGQGQRNAAVYRDGEYVGSSTGSTSGDDSATDYVTKKAWLREPQEVSSELTIAGNPLIDPSFPIADTDTLVTIVSFMKANNRGKKETVTMDIYDLEHIIDFTDSIIFEGFAYSLQSNKIEKTEKSKNKQSISIARWGA